MSCGSRGSWKRSGEGEALEHPYCSEDEGGPKPKGCNSQQGK